MKFWLRRQLRRLLRGTVGHPDPCKPVHGLLRRPALNARTWNQLKSEARSLHSIRSFLSSHHFKLSLCHLTLVISGVLHLIDFYSHSSCFQATESYALGRDDGFQIDYTLFH